VYDFSGGRSQADGGGAYQHFAVAAGARGYVLKDDIQEVIHGIQRVLDGGVYLSKQLEEEPA